MGSVPGFNLGISETSQATLIRTLSCDELPVDGSLGECQSRLASPDVARDGVRLGV